MKEEKKRAFQQGNPALPDEESSLIKEKFLLLAKEKENLETIILEQNDIIRNLEKENAVIAQTLGEYTESHKKMKEKLIEFDLLRNSELSDLKKKIQTLVTENKQLAAKKDHILKNADRDEKNILLKDQSSNLLSFSLAGADHGLKDLLDMKDHNLSAASERIRQLEQELLAAHEGLRKIGSERESFKKQLEEVSLRLQGPGSGKMYTEEELDQEIDFYNKEILSLKSDTETLTSVIKEKIRQIDILDEKVADLSAASERIRQLEQELLAAHEGLRNIGSEKESLKKQLEEVSLTLQAPGSGEMYTEEELDQEIDFYNKEILSLKSDTETLTSVIKEKTRQIDILDEKVAGLSKLLSHKDIELYEIIPRLQIKIQQLSDSIEKKVEENSLFASELADLNDKLSALSGELIQRDESFLEISEDYKQEKERWAELSREYESVKNQLESENTDLKREVASLSSEMQALETSKDRSEIELADVYAQYDDLSAENADFRQRIGRLEDARSTLETRLSAALRRTEELEANIQSTLTVLASKEQGIMDISTQAEDLRALNELQEAELEALKAALPDMKEQSASLYLEKQGLDEEKNRLKEELAALQARVSAQSSDDMDIRERLRTLENEKLTLEARLFGALQRIEALDAGMQSNLSGLSLKDQHITDLNHEVEVLRDELAALGVEKQEIETAKKLLKEELAALQARVDAQSSDDMNIRERLRTLEDEKLTLEARLSGALQRIEALDAGMQSNLSGLSLKDQHITDLNHEVEVLRDELAALGVEKQDIETAKKLLGEELAGLRDALAAFKAQGSAYNQAIAKMENEKGIIEGILSESRQKIAGLEEEVARHVSAFTSHGQEISDLKAEIEKYRFEVDSLRSENTELKNKSSEDFRKSEDYSAEKEELLRKISILEGAFRILRDDAVTRLPEETDFAQRPSNIVPATVSKKKNATSKRYAIYALLLVAVAGVWLYFFRYYYPVTGTRQRPAVTVDADDKLAFNEIFDRNTREASSKGIKLQATIMTDSLLRKGEASELAGFDFSRHLYFRISINSLEGPLSQDLIQNPLERLRLTEGSLEIDHPEYKQIDKIKIFYKKQVPMAITFYCAYPRNALGPDRKNLTLSLSDNNATIPLVWDVPTLIANKI